MLRSHAPALALTLAPVLALVLTLDGSAAAAPTDPVTVTRPPDVGEPFSPGVRLVADLEQDYVEEEFFIEGTGTIYTHADDPALRFEIEPLQENVPYRSRIIVRRPVNPRKFNGTVVIEWWNTTAGFDVAPVWDSSAEFFARDGLVYVGVTNSNQGMAHLTSGCSLFGVLPPTCTGRYDSLSLPDDGLAYEMVSQLANLLKSDSRQNPLPEGFDVYRVFHAGQSQQGGSVIAYANNFHFPANDGYFIQAASRARSICGTRGALPPGCIPQLDDPADRLPRRDLPVPVYRAMTENDLARSSTDTRQEDRGKFRYYEMAGTAHTTVHVDVELLPALPPFLPEPILLEDACLAPINSIADGPVLGSHLYNAMWRNMEFTAWSGWPAPYGDRLERDGNGEILRDAFGNSVGGIRTTQMSVPTASYGPINEANPANLPGPLLQLGNLFCVLSGTVAPFDFFTLERLYPGNSYARRVRQEAVVLMLQGFLLPADAQQVIDEARSSGIGAGGGFGCGVGFFSASAIPPLVWLRRRRRRT